MQDIVLYCKSYREDILRARRLADSIAKYNCDGLPFYVSVPRKDLGLFKQQLPAEGVSLFEDESILDSSFRGRSYADFLPPKQMQQVIKSEFWRLGIGKNYLAIDSDSYFIRDFYKKDFLAEPGTPYSLVGEVKDLFQFAARHRRTKIFENYRKERAAVQTRFARQGRPYCFGPAPFIWSSKVWQSLHERYIEPKGQVFGDLIGDCPSEAIWYGEALLAYEAIKLFPIDPLFKVFHYREQYEESLKHGEDEDIWSVNYLGVIKQSLWDESTDYSRRKRRSWRTFWLKR